MANTEAFPAILRRIGAHKPNGWVRFGYVKRDGSYVLVTGIAQDLAGIPGDVKGVRVDYRGQDTALELMKIASKTGLILFNVAGIEEGEKIREQRDAQRKQTVLAGASARRDAQAQGRHTRDGSRRCTDCGAPISALPGLRGSDYGAPDLCFDCA